MGECTSCSTDRMKRADPARTPASQGRGEAVEVVGGVALRAGDAIGRSTDAAEDRCEKRHLL